MSMDVYAEHIIAWGNRVRNGVSNLELQKVMYFALGEYIVDHGVDELVLSIYTEPFENWTYGPVVRTVYDRYKKFGRYFIFSGTHTEHPAYAVLNPYIKQNFEYSITEMVERSHSHQAWYGNMQEILTNNPVRLSLYDLTRDFHKEDKVGGKWVPGKREERT